MKYWNELHSLESEIIKLDTIHSIVKLTAEGLNPQVEFADIQAVFWHLEELISEANKNITEQYMNLFEAIRYDTQDDDLDGCDTTETDELSNVMSQWIQTK
jgi:hypothetical protein